MVITFEENNNKKYEVQDEHTEKIFNSIKEDILKICDKYKSSEKDLLISLMSIDNIIKSMNQNLSNKFGADRIIKIVGAVEIKEGE